MPKKVSTMIGLICRGGLPLAQWRIHIGHQDGIFNMCNHNAQETPKHIFFTCSLVQEVWDKVKRMREITWLPARIIGWWHTLTDIYNPLG